jgi:adenylosuccinate synthase
MPVTAIVGAQFGSEGKGAIAARLAHRFQVAVRTGGPNAGHSFFFDGRVWKMRQMPCAWINRDCSLIIGAGGVVDIEVLEKEIEQTGRIPLVDSHAAIILPEDRINEKADGLGKSIGSTLEGVGEARIGKIQRRNAERLAATSYRQLAVDDTFWIINRHIETGAHVLLEGTQGSGLSLHFGEWPYVTSHDTNVSQLMADAGIAASQLDHTLLVARTFPIRVGGNSGPLFNEMAWEDIPGHVAPERTTVTNRERRIGKWDSDLFRKAVVLNQPCGLALTFTDYVDPTIRGATSRREITPTVLKLIGQMEAEYGVPIVMIGTGGPEFSTIPVMPCRHGEVWQ